MKSFVLGLALVGMAVGAPALAGVKEGVDAWKAGDYAKAIGEWRGPAEAGEPDAQFNLGQAYKLGRGVPVDQAQALSWYRKAAASGHEQAQALLGLMLFQGGQREEAMTWLRKAADRGEGRAQYVVGTAYFNGDLLPKDWARAYAFMLRAQAAKVGAANQSLMQMEQVIPDNQKQAGIAIAREIERTAMLRSNEMSGPADTPLTMRTTVVPSPVGQTSVPPSTTPPAPAPVMAQTAPAAPWKAPSVAAPSAAEPSPVPAKSVATKPAAVASPPARTTQPVVAAAGGGWKIQLGAFSSADAARNAWTSLSAKAGLKALTPTYTPVKTLTRLQAGPLGSRAAAQQACAAVKATGTTCFAVAP
ncbi:MAG: SPOR domain-containing protein [Pseudomonadota bacterium]